VALGDGTTGQALIGAVDCLMFTGSTRTGKSVMKAAADALIPRYLELGGKDPMIGCADANIERAANAAAFYSMNNAGQVCISVERVYVEEPVYDEFVKRVTDNIRGLRQGEEEGVRMANDSEYGLQAGVWTGDVDRGESIARRLEAGVVCVNDAQINYTALNLPMGGWKASGLGSRHGAGGIRKYCKIQSLLVT